MNSVFYLALERLPLGTVAAIEFLPVIVLAALAARIRRNLARAGRSRWPASTCSPTCAWSRDRWASPSPASTRCCSPRTSCSAHRVAKDATLPGLDGLALAMLIAAVVALPVGLGGRGPGVHRPAAAGRGRRRRRLARRSSRTSADQLAMARLPRATYALMVSLLPATATVIGVIVLTQIPGPAEILGVVLVVGGVALHAPAATPRAGDRAERGVHPTTGPVTGAPT